MRSKKETHTHKRGRDNNNGHGYLMKNDEKQEARLETYELTNKLQSAKKVKKLRLIFNGINFHAQCATTLRLCNTLIFFYISFIFLVVCVILVFVFFLLALKPGAIMYIAIPLENQINR